MTSTVPRQFSCVVGDGETTKFAIDHHLHSKEVAVEAYDAQTGDLIHVNTTVTGLDTVVIDFGCLLTLSTHRKVGPWRVRRRTPQLMMVAGSAPGTDAVKVVIVG